MISHLRAAVPAFLILSIPKFLLLAADNAVPEGALSRIEIPEMEVIEGAKDIELEEVAGWMNEIAANIQSTSSDCRTKIEATIISTPSSGDPQVNSVVAAMRIAKKPDKSLERYVVVRQNPDSNLSLVQDERLIDDNRRHADILRVKGQMYYSSLTTFDYNVGEVRSEKDWDPNAVKYYQFYDPISVCTTNITTVVSGNTHGGIQHIFRDENVKGTLRVGKYVHVLLECPVYSGAIVRLHFKFIATFHNGVPVQFARIDGVDRQTGRPQVRDIMRSHWNEYGEGDDRQLLPTYIVGMQQDETQVGQLEISCDWKLGREVSDSLFDVKTLGSIAPAEDVVVGIPKKLLEMLSEPSED